MFLYQIGERKKLRGPICCRIKVYVLNWLK